MNTVAFPGLPWEGTPRCSDTFHRFRQQGMLWSEDGFRWRARAWHLTYAGHVPPEILLLLLGAATSVPVLGTSIVHETSDAEAPYDHTHFAWLWAGPVNLHGAHIMDAVVDARTIHPHAEHRKSLPWLQGIFERYHHGYKACGGRGQSKFVQPHAGPWQVLPPGFEWHAAIITEVSEAADVIEGAQIAGVQIRSMHDVMLAQNHKRPPPFEHNFERSTFLPLEMPLEFTSRVVGTLHVHGERDLGKTEWALSRFENPLYVTERNVLLDFRAGWHDGIVIDKLLPREVFSLYECEALTDYTQPAAIKCLYKVARIPKRTPKIVVTNERDAWPQDPHGILVGRRVVQMHVTAKTYNL